MSKTREYSVFNGDDEERVWTVETLDDGTYRVSKPDGTTLEVDAFSPADDQLHMLVEGRSVDATIMERDPELQVQIESQRHHVEVLNERQRRMRAAGAGAAAGGAPELVSPMAGQVVKIICEPGDRVESGDRLLVVEAMKMENDLEAHRGGVVDSIEVQAGDSVDIDDVLIVIADADDD